MVKMNVFFIPIRKEQQRYSDMTQYYERLPIPDVTGFFFQILMIARTRRA